MIAWKQITIEDRDWITEKLREDDRQSCEYSFANNFIWAPVYQVEVALEQSCCLIRFAAEEGVCYAFPVGKGEKKAALELLRQDAEEQNSPFRLVTLLAQDKAYLEENFPGEFQIKEDRDSFDYIYTVEKLTSLSGKKLHGKRNHIARFKDNEDWSYEPLTEENKQECYEMNLAWCDRRSCKWNEEMSGEQCALERAFAHFTELGLEGGVLRLHGKIVAFTVGERLNSDTYVVHFEKAFPEIQGAYPMINQQFVLRNCQHYTYVNREEDTGDEGLRKAKLSYYPDILLEQYNAVYCGK